MTAVSLWKKRKLSHKGRLRRCILLICLVTAPVISALMFSESMMTGIANKYICLSDGHLQANYAIDLSNRSDLDGIVYSSDEVTKGYVLLYSSNSTSSCMLKGTHKEYFNEKRLSELSFAKAETNNSNLKKISISRTTAQTLGVKPGDKIAMMVVSDSTKNILRPSLVIVDSVFHTGYDQLDKLISFTDIEFAKDLFRNEDATSTEILLEDAYVEKLQEANELIGAENLSFWTEHNSIVYSNFQTSRESIFIVLATIIVVAAFYTASVAQQMIQDDIKEIATMKLLGSSNKLVCQWAFETVFSITVTGTVLGIVLGTAIGFGLGPLMSYISEMGFYVFSYYLLDFKISFPFVSVLKMICLLLSVSALSVLISLRRTKSIRPIQLFNS